MYWYFDSKWSWCEFKRCGDFLISFWDWHFWKICWGVCVIVTLNVRERKWLRKWGRMAHKGRDVIEYYWDCEGFEYWRRKRDFDKRTKVEEESHCLKEKRKRRREAKKKDFSVWFLFFVFVKLKSERRIEKRWESFNVFFFGNVFWMFQWIIWMWYDVIQNAVYIFVFEDLIEHFSCDRWILIVIFWFFFFSFFHIYCDSLGSM